MYKLIAIDMDDTLLSEDLTISKENYEALKKAHEKGVRVVICTGRPYPSTKKYVEQLNFLGKDDVYVSFNGAIISKVTGEDIFQEYISKELLSEVIKISRDYDINLQFYSKEDVIVEKYNNLTIEYERLSGMKAKQVKDLGEEPYSVKALFTCPDIVLLNKIQDGIKEKHSDELSCFFSKPTFLELLDVKANKGLAVKHLAEYYGIKQEEVVTIGDSYNDMFMIEYAGLGCAIANGREDLKAVADYVTENDHNNHGVAEVINKFILNVNQ